MSPPPTAHNSVGSSTQGGNRNTSHSEAVPSMHVSAQGNGMTPNNIALCATAPGFRTEWQMRPAGSNAPPPFYSPNTEPFTINQDANGWIQASNDGGHFGPNFIHFNPDMGALPREVVFNTPGGWNLPPPHLPGARNDYHNGPPMFMPAPHLPFLPPHLHNAGNHNLVENDRSSFAGPVPIPPAFTHNIPPHSYAQGPGPNGHPGDYGAYYCIPPPEMFPDFSFGFDTYQVHGGAPPHHYPGAFPIVNNGMGHPNGGTHGPIVPGARQMNDQRPQPLIRPHEFRHGPPPATPGRHAPHMMHSPLGPPLMPPSMAQGPRSWLRSNQQHGNPNKFQGKVLNNNLKPPRGGYYPMTPHFFPMSDRSAGKAHNRPHNGSANGQQRSNPNKRPPIPHDTTPPSPLLVEFRSSNDPNWKFEDIVGYIAEFSRDQYGSRFIQHAIETADLAQKETVFGEIAPDHLSPLLRHVFGNYVIQKLLEFGTQAQIDAIVALVEEQAYELSLDIYGCRVVQKAIETVSEEHIKIIISKLEPDIFECIQDSNGNHVIQKLVEVVDPSLLTFLPFISDNLCTLAKHPYGCRVLQRCLEHLSAKYSEHILIAIHANITDLMEDQYGNYVIQFIIQNGRVHDQKKIYDQICAAFIDLARHKYASNVCERALVCADSETRARMISGLLEGDPSDFKHDRPLSRMVKDQYGNYVLQQVLRVVEGEQKTILALQLPPLLVFLQQTTSNYSRSITSLHRVLREEMRRI